MAFAKVREAANGGRQEQAVDDCGAELSGAELVDLRATAWAS